MDSEPVAGPSGLQQTPCTAQGSDGRVLSSKRKREDAFQLEEELAGPSKKSRSKSPRPENNNSNKRKTPEDDSAEEKEQRRGSPPFTPVSPETLSHEEAQRNSCDLYAKYYFRKPIGCGGFGTVYAGCRREDGFAVAIKKMKKKRVPYTETEVNGVMCKLPVEVALLIRLGAGPENPSCSITPLLLDWYDLGKHVVLVFERPEPCMDILGGIEAGSIKYRDVEKAKIILRQLVEQAIKMEAKGVFHRDIKPDNVLIETGSDGLKARFIDFGCGTTFTPGQIFKDRQGTVAYSSPEWFRHSPYTAGPVTVWQLGLVLYYLLFQKLPLINSYNFASWRALPVPGTVPEECRDFLGGCLDKNPNRRFTLEDMRNHPWLRPE